MFPAVTNLMGVEHDTFSVNETHSCSVWLAENNEISRVAGRELE